MFDGQIILESSKPPCHTLSGLLKRLGTPLQTSSNLWPPTLAQLLFACGECQVMESFDDTMSWKGKDLSAATGSTVLTGIFEVLPLIGMSAWIFSHMCLSLTSPELKTCAHANTGFLPTLLLCFALPLFFSGAHGFSQSIVSGWDP